MVVVVLRNLRKGRDAGAWGSRLAGAGHEGHVVLYSGPLPRASMT